MRNTSWTYVVDSAWYFTVAMPTDGKDWGATKGDSQPEVESDGRPQRQRDPLRPAVSESHRNAPTRMLTRLLDFSCNIFPAFFFFQQYVATVYFQNWHLHFVNSMSWVYNQNWCRQCWIRSELNVVNSTIKFICWLTNSMYSANYLNKTIVVKCILNSFFLYLIIENKLSPSTFYF